MQLALTFNKDKAKYGAQGHGHNEISIQVPLDIGLQKQCIRKKEYSTIVILQRKRKE